MHPLIKNTLAVIVGLLVGGFLNSFIIGLNGTWIPLPPGVDLNTQEGLSLAMSSFEPIHFSVIFLAHALGTCLASWIAVRFSATKSWNLGRIPGVVFFLGGVYMVYLLDAPAWFEACDLLLAYFPFSWIGYKLGRIRAMS